MKATSASESKQGMTMITVPARVIFDRATAYNREHGHENRGFLSEERGFLPRISPLQQFPASHQYWDAMVERLPTLYRQMTVRAELDHLPVLHADAEHCSHLEYIRVHSGFCRQITATSQDVHRAWPPLGVGKGCDVRLSEDA